MDNIGERGSRECARFECASGDETHARGAVIAMLRPLSPPPMPRLTRPPRAESDAEALPREKPVDGLAVGRSLLLVALPPPRSMRTRLAAPPPPSPVGRAR